MSRSCQSAHVLEADERRRAHDAREPRDPLGHLRVALVRHRRRALHPGRERLLDLAHLGAREVPDLGREAVERRRHERERREQLRVPVARDHLRRDRIGLEPEPLARDALDLGLDRRVRPDRARELADAVRPRARAAAASGRGRARTPSRRASSRTSSAPRGCRASARCRSCAGAPAPAARPRRARARAPASDERARLADLQRERRVDDVRRGEPVVEPAPLGPELLGHRVDERRRVVVGDALDLRHALGRRRHGAARGSPRRPRPGSRRPRPIRRARRARPRASAPASAPPTTQRPWPVASSGRSRGQSRQPVRRASSPAAPGAAMRETRAMRWRRRRNPARRAGRAAAHPEPRNVGGAAGCRRGRGHGAALGLLLRRSVARRGRGARGVPASRDRIRGARRGRAGQRYDAADRRRCRRARRVGRVAGAGRGRSRRVRLRRLGAAIPEPPGAGA